MQLNFKLAEPHDTTTLQSLWVQAHSVHLGAEYLQRLDEEKKGFTKKHQRQFDDFFKGIMGEGKIFIAYHNMTPVGYSWISLDDNDQDLATITEIFSTQKGSGTAIIKHTENMARINGRSIVELEAYEESIGFYEKMGYLAQDDRPVQRSGLIACTKYI